MIINIEYNDIDIDIEYIEYIEYREYIKYRV